MVAFVSLEYGKWKFETNKLKIKISPILSVLPIFSVKSIYIVSILTNWYWPTSISSQIKNDCISLLLW